MQIGGMKVATVVKPAPAPSASSVIKISGAPRAVSQTRV